MMMTYHDPSCFSMCYRHRRRHCVVVVVVIIIIIIIAIVMIISIVIVIFIIITINIIIISSSITIVIIISLLSIIIITIIVHLDATCLHFPTAAHFLQPAKCRHERWADTLGQPLISTVCCVGDKPEYIGDIHATTRATCSLVQTSI